VKKELQKYMYTTSLVCKGKSDFHSSILGGKKKKDVYRYIPNLERSFGWEHGLLVRENSLLI
jgi:hypothetical protein